MIEVLVSRKPPAKGAGKGSANKYLCLPPVVFQQRVPVNANVFGARVAPVRLPEVQTVKGSDAEKINAMFKQQDHLWSKTQEGMANVRPVYRPTSGTSALSYSKQWAASERPMPAGYVCYRCGKQGHHIQACPTIGDPEFDNRARFKKTTGIPRIFLKTVQTTSTDPAAVDAGVMVNLV